MVILCSRIETANTSCNAKVKTAKFDRALEKKKNQKR